MTTLLDAAVKPRVSSYIAAIATRLAETTRGADVPAGSAASR